MHKILPQIASKICVANNIYGRYIIEIVGINIVWQFLK